MTASKIYNSSFKIDYRSPERTSSCFVVPGSCKAVGCPKNSHGNSLAAGCTCDKGSLDLLGRNQGNPRRGDKPHTHKEVGWKGPQLDVDLLTSSSLPFFSKFFFVYQLNALSVVCFDFCLAQIP